MIETSNQFYVNIKDKPKWETGKPFSAQSKDTQEFYEEEARKAKNGVTINGVEIHPWLYWHVNFWQMFVDYQKEDGTLDRKPQRSSLRDNEYFINENLIRAEAERKGIIMFGTRRFGKSAFISSYIAWNATFKYGGVNSVVGGNQEDLDNVTEYIDFGLENVPEMFRYDRVGNDWDKGVTLGTRTTRNRRNIFSTMKVTNVNRGQAKSSQKTAGKTPSSFVMDEIGKYPCKKAFNTAKYSFSTPFGWRCIPILIGTGGEVEESQDAQSIVANPEVHNLIQMDWDLLRNCDNPTWVKKNWGLFVPAQMSMEPGLVKEVITLDKHLGIEDEDLAKIEIHVTDWTVATKILQERRDELEEKDPETHIDEMMFLPFDTDDCFLQTGKNPFPTIEATRHRRKLVETGNIGKHADIYRINGTTRLGYESSSLKPAKFPFEGGNINAPVLIFEDPPEVNDMDGTYVGGLDHYKHTKADTDSLGAYYVFKRRVNLNDPWSERIVASYTSRPDHMTIFNNTVEQIMEGYGAETLQENADVSFQQHLEDKHKALMWLANGEDLAKLQINSRARQNNKIGLSPTQVNQEYLLKLVIQYCQEVIELGEDENGDKIVMKGVERIPDIYLLDEIIGFKYGKNHDRIIAFGHALAWARYLDKLGIYPKVKVEKTSEYQKQVRKQKLKNRSPYGSRRFGAY